MENYDTFNKFLVGLQNDNIVILNLGPLPHRVSKESALNLAAYLVTLAGASDEEFLLWLRAVQST